jgi:superfamily II DNA or RNA helicase
MKTINPGITIVQRGTPVRHRSTGTTAVALNETSISLARPLDAPLAEDSPEFALRPYQSEALKACVLALDEGDERIGVGMPVGSGRTLV